MPPWYPLKSRPSTVPATRSGASASPSRLLVCLLLTSLWCQPRAPVTAASERPGDETAKLSQYDEAITSSHGRSACGLFSLATTLGEMRSQKSVNLEIDRLRAIADEENAYDNGAGIQPSSLLSLARQAYPDWTVEACSGLALSDLRAALQEGHGVIVDIQVGVAFHQGEFPSSAPPNLAHFCRVLSIDYEERRVLLENSLRGGPFWELPIDDFLTVWKYPETAVSIKPGKEHPNRKLHPEEVTHWALIAGRRTVNVCDGPIFR